MKNNYETMTNPYCYYESEPFRLARWKEDGVKYLAGIDNETGEISYDHSKSVIKMAHEKDYTLPKDHGRTQENTKSKITIDSIDSIVFTVGFFLCIILFAGTPDLMDAIIQSVIGK
jgi:hypothetical protein